MKKILFLCLFTTVAFWSKSQTDSTRRPVNDTAIVIQQQPHTTTSVSGKMQKRTKRKVAALGSTQSCFTNCGGTSLDTLCPERKECCETGLCRSNGTYILQKNFADIQPFAYRYFRLNGRKENLCIRICNINRIAYDINGNGQVVKATLPDTSIFDGLAKLYQGVPVVVPKEPTEKDTSRSTIRQDQTITELARSSGRRRVRRRVSAAPSGPSPFEILKGAVAKKKQEVNNVAAALSVELVNLQHYTHFAAEVPAIIGGECCSQQRIKDRIGSQPDIKAFRPDINFDNVMGIVKQTMPVLFDSSKSHEKQLRELLKELGGIINEYRQGYCETNLDNASNCSQLAGLGTLPDQQAIDKNLSIASQSDKAALLKSLQVLEDLLARVNNNANFFYTQCFDKDDAEFVKIYVKASPKEGFAGKLDSQVYRYTVPVTGRFKWAIGPSLNFHFGGTLINQSYSIDSARNNAGTIMTDTFSISRNSQRSRVVPHVGFMAHFYWQQHWRATPGVCIGISTSPTQFSDLRAYLGASGIIGGPVKGKLILSAGLAGAAVERLKPNLLEGHNAKNRILFNGNNLPSAEQLVDKVFRIGFFVGMTYNLRD